jgi:hypothetical protein
MVARRDQAPIRQRPLRQGHREIYVTGAHGGKALRITHSPAQLWATQPDWQSLP